MDTPKDKPLTNAEIAALARAQKDAFTGNAQIAAARTRSTFVARAYDSDRLQSLPRGSDRSDPAPMDTPGKSAEFKASDQPPMIDVEAEKRAAFEAGKAEAEQAHKAAIVDIQKKAEQIAQWDADKRISAESDLLRAVAARLASEIDSVQDTLARHIEQAVQELASERAGSAIDAMPAAFVARIDRLAGEIAAQATQAMVMLHPEDLKVVATQVTDADWLGDARLVADPSLRRGDVALQFGDVSVTNRLDTDQGSLAS